MTRADFACHAGLFFVAGFLLYLALIVRTGGFVP